MKRKSIPGETRKVRTTKVSCRREANRARNKDLYERAVDVGLAVSTLRAYDVHDRTLEEFLQVKPNKKKWEALKDFCEYAKWLIREKELTGVSGKNYLLSARRYLMQSKCGAKLTFKSKPLAESEVQMGMDRGQKLLNKFSEESQQAICLCEDALRRMSKHKQIISLM